MDATASLDAAFAGVDAHTVKDKANQVDKELHNILKDMNIDVEKTSRRRRACISMLDKWVSKPLTGSVAASSTN